MEVYSICWKLGGCMILAIIFLFILICIEFIFFYIKILSMDKEMEELYDMYYDLYKPRSEKKGNITVFSKKVVK